jgi:hypothetical protein
MNNVKGQQVRLKGLTKKGKERIKQHGDVWTINEVSRQNLENRILLIAPDGDWRWVFEKSDLNFAMVEVVS